MVSIEELQKDLDEFKEKYNQLLQTLEEIGLKQKVNFTELEVDIYGDLEEETETEEETDTII